MLLKQSVGHYAGKAGLPCCFQCAFYLRLLIPRIPNYDIHLLILSNISPCSHILKLSPNTLPAATEPTTNYQQPKHPPSRALHPLISSFLPGHSVIIDDCLSPTRRFSILQMFRWRLSPLIPFTFHFFDFGDNSVVLPGKPNKQVCPLQLQLYITYFFLHATLW